MLTGRLGWWRLYPLVVGCVLQTSDMSDMSDVPHEIQKTQRTPCKNGDFPMNNCDFP